jgi:hypothetical protein
MFPFCFEWVWDVGHAIFFGGTWYAVSILGVGLTWVVGKTIYETITENSDEIH